MLDEVSDGSIEDLYPKTKDEHTMMLARCERKFLSSESWRSQHQSKWERFYTLAQSFVQREKGEWGSKVFVPLIFTTIQTILPRLVAQLPEPIVAPVGPEDEVGASEMEELLKWCAEQSGLFFQLVTAFDSALTYGTGILKVTPSKKVHTRRKRQDIMEPVTQAAPMIDPETQAPLMGPDGQAVMDQVQTGQERPTGRSQMVEEEIVSYVGPMAECLPLMAVFVDPMSTSFEDAEYVIHRSFKPKSWVDVRIKSGFFVKPDYFDERDLSAALDDPTQRLMSSVGLGGAVTEEDRVEVWECWYRDGVVITTLNRRIIVRVVNNPFDHGEFPFIRIIDHLRPHEFYGDGEVTHLEGVQDLINALTNQRVDNVRLVLEKVFYGSEDAIKDRRDLKLYPGAFIPVNTGDLPLDQVFRPLDMGDVTNSSYNEVEFWKGIAEQVSGVSPYQTGTDGGAQNDTATGVALISEQGNTRFTMKLKMAELTGIQALYRQYGALIQQFMPDDFVLRIVGPDGVTTFKQVEPAAIYGAFDYDIEGESSAQTETVRKQTQMELFNLALSAVDPVTGQPIFNLQARAEDLLRAFNIKDMERNLAPQQLNPAIPPGMAEPGMEQMPEDQMSPNGQPQPQGAYPA